MCTVSAATPEMTAQHARNTTELFITLFIGPHVDFRLMESTAHLACRLEKKMVADVWGRARNQSSVQRVLVVGLSLAVFSYLQSLLLTCSRIVLKIF